MNPSLLECPNCKTELDEAQLNQAQLAPCPLCGVPLQVEIFPALFRRVTPGQNAEAILVEGESGCFYHPQKKAVAPCDLCGRFLCALCDCEVKGQHLCPTCLESGQKKRSIAGLEDRRVLYNRQALVLAILPLFVSGLAALYLVLRHRQEPGSLVQPLRWAFPVTLILASLQTLVFLFLIGMAFFK